jgi:thiol-disulfide isomerase/thioredoxin
LILIKTFVLVVAKRWFCSKQTAIVAVLLFLLQDINAQQTFTLKGEIVGNDSGYAYLRYFRDEIKKKRTDTVAIINGKFQFIGMITGVDYALLETNSNQGTELFIEPGIINVAFDMKGNKVNINGSESQKEYDDLRKYTNKENIEIHQMTVSYRSVDSLLKSNLINPQTAEKRRKEIGKMYEPFLQSKSKKEFGYIKDHPKSYVSLFLLQTLIGTVPYDSIETLYVKLSDSIKGSTLDYKFLEYSARIRKAFNQEYPFDKLKLNEKAPLFRIYNSLTNDSLVTDQLKGKVVILEFWGVNCFPCLKSNPYLETIRKQYSINELEVIGINNNEVRDIPNLISYINKNKLSGWIHVFLNEQVKEKNSIIFKGDFSNYVGLEMPRTILIDKSGRVVYKNYGYSPEEMQNLKLLINKAVNERSSQD